MRRFIECLIPLTACNLKCSYCYVIHQGRRNNEQANFLYSPETIGKALSVDRLGGVSFISMTASGETFISPELPYVSLEILKQGHFINITTNGTLTSQIQKFLEVTEEYHSRIHISFSFHYMELKEKGLLDAFFDNIDRVRSAGCSMLLQINLADEYVPYWDEIKRLSKERVGAYPQVALTRERCGGIYKIMTQTMTDEAYIDKGREMDSPLFDFTCQNFMVKRSEYCYAGYWSAKLNLCTGEMTGCYGLGVHQNIFKDISKPIKWVPIGNNCKFCYCINSSHFISQGIIPELLPQPSYGQLRNRETAQWYTPQMKEFLYTQFEKTNELLPSSKRIFYNLLVRFYYSSPCKRMCNCLLRHLGISRK